MAELHSYNSMKPCNCGRARRSLGWWPQSYTVTKLRDMSRYTQGAPWHPWDEGFAALGKPAPTADLFLANCLAQGYLTSVDEPVPDALAGWEAADGR